MDGHRVTVEVDGERLFDLADVPPVFLRMFDGLLREWGRWVMTDRLGRCILNRQR